MAFMKPDTLVAALDGNAVQRVADFGAGTGELARRLARVVGKEGEVYLIDIQSALLTKVKHLATPEELKVLRFLTGDLARPGGSHLTDGLLDAVYMVTLLFQVEDKRACLLEAFRVLSVGGLLVLADWRDSFGGIGPRDELVVGQETAYALAQEVGLTYESDIPLGAYHWGMRFRK